MDVIISDGEGSSKLTLNNLTPEQEEQLIYETDVLFDLQMVWEPHAHQQLVKNAVFAEGKKTVFLECGRKYGKTDILCYILYRFAMMYPNSACYYIAPFQKQAKEIIWANGRLQNFLMPVIDPKTKKTHKGHSRSEAFQIYEELREKYVKSINDSEMRIKFHNGSFIKLDGADNHQAYRGISPSIMVYDEYKDHNPRFHTGMEPNLATFDAPLIAVGTPPEGDEANEEHFYSMADYAKIDDDQAYFNAPTYVNPYISREFLRRKKKELYAKNESDKWLREYMAKRVKSGSRSIFPMFEAPDEERKHTKHVKPHRQVVAEILRYPKDWDILVSYDPASVSTFGVLFVAIHRWEKRIKVFEEIYAEGMAKTSTKQVFPKSLEILDKYGFPYFKVDMLYDNAASWFYNEVMANYEMALTPCMKDYNTKNDKLSMIKDIFLAEEGAIEISDKCEKFIFEVENYRTDDKGKIPKENDHLIDDFRYILNHNGYETVPQPQRNPNVIDGGRRFVKLGEEAMEPSVTPMTNPWAGCSGFDDY